MKSGNLYENSWELYKLESQEFSDDFDYYKDLCKNKNVLELSAGYGRLANQLKDIVNKIECVELEKNFTQFINSPKNNIHVCNVLEFNSTKSFERIIAGYNSFTLPLRDEDIIKLFKNIYSWLTIDGIASLSYYNYETLSPSEEKEISLGGVDYAYNSNFIKNEKNSNIGTWVDTYSNVDTGETIQFDYPVRIYNSTHNKIIKFSDSANLELIDVVHNYGNKNESETEWFEYVFKKNN